VLEKPEDPPSNLVMTGFYTFTPAIFHACHLVQPSDRASTRSPTRSTCCSRAGAPSTPSGWTAGASTSATLKTANGPKSACRSRPRPLTDVFQYRSGGANVTGYRQATHNKAQSVGVYCYQRTPGVPVWS